MIAPFEAVAQAQASKLERAVVQWGGKGAGLCQMVRLRMPVPQGFILDTGVSRRYFSAQQKLPQAFAKQLRLQLAALEKKTQKKWGSTVSSPLLVSVRSGSPESMPGMMSTVLNVGLNHEVLASMLARGEDPRFCYDIYRRFLASYAEVVFGLDSSPFEKALNELRIQCAVKTDCELPAQALQHLVAVYEDFIRKAECKVPESIDEQLLAAIEAVLQSFKSARASVYRKLHSLSEKAGTAVVVQTMVFGNRSQKGATGVAFSRHPLSGEPGVWGEYLPVAQGHDVVAGVRSALPLQQSKQSLARRMPSVFRQLQNHVVRLEKFYRQVVEVEFTVEDGQLYLLQVRAAKLTALAHVRANSALVKEKLITKKMYQERVTDADVEKSKIPTIDIKKYGMGVARGVPASSGVGIGHVAFDVKTVERFVAENKSILLVQHEMTIDSVQAASSVSGILTAVGGMASHAATVARKMNKVAVVSVRELVFSTTDASVTLSGEPLCSGDLLTIDGTTGCVYREKVPVKLASSDSSKA